MPPAVRPAASVAIDLVEHVVVGERHALGVAGGARGVEDGRRVVGGEAASSGVDPRRGRRGARAPRARKSSQLMKRSPRVGVPSSTTTFFSDRLVEHATPAGQVVGAPRTTTRRLDVAGDEGHLVRGQGVVHRHGVAPACTAPRSARTCSMRLMP